MKVGYIVKSHDNDIKDTIYFREVFFSIDEDEKRELVHAACEHAWRYNDGREWLRCGEVITLVVDDVEQGDFPVDVEWEPVFFVHKEREVVEVDIDAARVKQME